MIDLSTKLIAIVGPTASGKTTLAIRLAEKVNGEIICADSRTIYRGMDIGTAKPTASERARVPHHLLDMIEPDQTYSARQFKAAAEQAISAIVGRGRVPFLVGGTGLYVHSVVYDFQFPAGPRTDQRAELERRPLAELVEQLERQDPERARTIDRRNPRRVIRALETIGQPLQRELRLSPNILLIGLRLAENVLSTNIIQRTEAMFEAGIVAEVIAIVDRYGPNLEVLKSPGYTEVVDYLAGITTLAAAKDLISLHTRQLVKRQLTWLKRNPEINWISDPAEAEPLVEAFL